MIKKFLICLLTLFAITPAFAGEGYVVFKSEAVEDAINTRVAPDKRNATAAEYQKQMDAQTGKISVSGMYKVCSAAGFDIKQRGGWEDCQNFLGDIISESGLGDAATKCAEEYDGMVVETGSGRNAQGAYYRQTQCVGRDGKPLDYRNACKDKKSGDTADQCWEQFSDIEIQYATAKAAIQTWANERFKTKVMLTCKNVKTVAKTKKKDQGYLYCSAGGKPYTFKFKKFTPQNDVDAERAGIAEFICKLTNPSKYSAAIATVSGTQDNGFLYFTCIDDHKNTVANSQTCGVMNKYASMIGNYSAQIENNVHVKKGGGAMLSEKSVCLVRGGRTDSTKLVNELADRGFDNYKFNSITVRNSEEVINKVRDYAREQLGGFNTVECEYSGASITGAGMFGLLEKKKYDVVRCVIDGKKVDMVFANLSTKTNFRTKGGLQGLDCKVNGGKYTGKTCEGLGEAKCKELQKVSAKTCPECKQVQWDGEYCVLPNSASVRRFEQGVKVGTIVVLAGTAAAITVGTGGLGATAGVVLFGIETAGAIMEVDNTLKIQQHAQDFLHQSANCHNETCAKELLGKLRDLAAEQHDYTETEVKEIDAALDELVDLIPDESDFWDKVLYDPKDGLAANDEGLRYWTPEQIWRAVGVGLQMAGLFYLVAQKFLIKGAPGLTRGTTKITQRARKLLPAPAETKLITAGKETKLLTGGDDAAKLLKGGDDVKLIGGQKMTRADAKALQDIEYRNAKRAAGTATAHEKSLQKADFQKQQELLKRYGFTDGYGNTALNNMYAEAHAVMQNEAIVAKESELAKAEEHLKWLREHPSQATKGDISSTEASVKRLTQELADMGRTYADTADDAARVAGRATDNADDAARVADNGVEVTTRKLNSEFGFDFDNEIRNISSGKSNELRIPKSRANLSESEWALLQEKLRREGLEMTDVPGRFGTDQIIIAKRGTNVADAARAAGRTAAEIDNTYKVGMKAETRAEILEKWGLKPDAMDAEVTARYRDLAKKFHPDVAGNEFTNVFADIAEEKRLLDSLPRGADKMLVESPRVLQLTNGSTGQVVTSAARELNMAGHEIWGVTAAARGLARAIHPSDGGEIRVTDAGGSDGETLGTVAGVGTGAIVGGVLPNGTPGTPNTSGTNGIGGVNNLNDVDEIYGGELEPAIIVADRTSPSSTTPSSPTLGATTPSSTTPGETVTTNGGGAHRNTNSVGNNNKGGISGLGAAAIGAGVVGVGIGAALLLGADRGDKATTSPVEQTGNIDLFNAARTRANGIIGYVDDAAIELVPIETVNGINEKIVFINGHAVVLVKHNNNTIPFMVETMGNVAQWVPFTNVDMNTGAFKKYVPTTDIMRTAKIAETLGSILPPLQMQYFAAPNPDGITFTSPSANGYKLINENDLRYLAFDFDKNRQFGGFFFTFV